MHRISIRGLATATASLIGVSSVALGVGAWTEAPAADGAVRPPISASAAHANGVAEKAARHAVATKHTAEERAKKKAAAKRRAAKRAAAEEAARERAEERASRAARSADPRAIAQGMLGEYGWSSDQFSCLDSLWQKESGWDYQAANPTSSAYGIPQALPGSKMASAGSDWQSNPATQIEWGLGYIAQTYGSPCAAWEHSEANNWY